MFIPRFRLAVSFADAEYPVKISVEERNATGGCTNRLSCTSHVPLPVHLMTQSCLLAGLDEGWGGVEQWQPTGRQSIWEYLLRAHPCNPPLALVELVVYMQRTPTPRVWLIKGGLKWKRKGPNVGMWSKMDIWPANRHLTNKYSTVIS